MNCPRCLRETTPEHIGQDRCTEAFWCEHCKLVVIPHGDGLERPPTGNAAWAREPFEVGPDFPRCSADRREATEAVTDFPAETGGSS